MMQVNGSIPKQIMSEPTLETKYRAYLSRFPADEVDAELSKPLFDDKLLALLEEFSVNRSDLDTVVRQLNGLRSSADHARFGRNILNYNSVRETLESFASPEAENRMWNVHVDHAFNVVKSRYQKFRLQTLEYRTDTDIRELLRGMDTSTGFSGWELGVSHKCDVPEEGLLDGYFLRRDEALREGKYSNPYLMFFRGQASGEYDPDSGEFTGTFKRKTRPVWCVDFWQYLAELRFVLPLNSYLRNYAYSAIGDSDQDVLQWVDWCRMRYQNWVSLDYSKYDSTIPSWLIKAAFAVIRSAFPCLSDEDFKLLKVLETSFIEKTVLTKDGPQTFTHGNPSGSGFTAIVNGICNEIITETWLHKWGLKGYYKIMGDDNLIYTYEKVDLPAIASYVTHVFGVKVHDDEKLSVGESGDSPWFLSRQWRPGGAWRHPHELISKMLYPERFRRYGCVRDFTPALVLYSYVQAYPGSIRDVIDVDKFLQSFQLDEASIYLSGESLRNLPWVVQQHFRLGELESKRVSIVQRRRVSLIGA